MSPRMRVLIFSSKLSASVLAILLLSLVGCASKPKSPDAAGLRVKSAANGHPRLGCS